MGQDPNTYVVECTLERTQTKSECIVVWYTPCRRPLGCAPIGGAREGLCLLELDAARRGQPTLKALGGVVAKLVTFDDWELHALAPRPRQPP